jgi:acyl-CoA synthetase (NDP forming)
MFDLDRLFYPQGVALIGVSDQLFKGATGHLYALRQVNYQGSIYNVNKYRKKVMFDEDAYPSILDVPAQIDYAIVGVPRHEVPQIVKECCQKNVKFVTIFTAGFSELGTDEGRELERKILQNVTDGLRIIGPNCLGPYCQESRVTMSEILEIKQPGETAFISQSGGHTGSFFYIGENRGFPFNKVVSLGNQLDLTIQDFVEYFANDKKIKTISCYLEQIKDVKTFLTALRKAAREKPVIFWKGGRTEEGNIAAASHTGAISSSYPIFQSAVNQNGGMVSESIEELADLTMGALFLSEKNIGKRLGMLVPGGGSCVEMTDEAVKHGLQVSPLAGETREKIKDQIQKVNTSTRNPVDLGVLGWSPNIFAETMTLLANDPNVDVVAFYFMTERLKGFMQRMGEKSLERSFLENIGRVAGESNKAFICIMPDFVVTDYEITRLRKSFSDGLFELKVPHFPSMDRAANVIKKLIQYKRFPHTSLHPTKS